MIIRGRISFNKNEAFYLPVFAFYILAVILSYSTLNTGRMLIYIARILLIVSSFGQFAIRTRFKLKRIELLIGIIFIAVVVKIKSGYWSILDIGLLMFGSIGVDFDKIVRMYRVIATSTLLFIIGLYCCGIIEENAFTRAGFVRHSFGFIYATDLAALIFYILLADFYIAHNSHQKMWIRYGIYILLAGAVYYFCNARLGTACILLLIPSDVYLRCRKGKLLQIEKLILSYCIPIFTLMIIISVQIYIIYPRHILFSALDRLLSFRLYYSKMGVIYYGYKLFGQEIEMHGAGESDYFFIDSSYMNIALIYGIVILLLVNILFVKASHKRVENHDLLIPVIIFLIAVNSIVGQQMLDIAYDVFLLLFFADFKQSILKMMKGFKKNGKKFRIYYSESSDTEKLNGADK